MKCEYTFWPSGLQAFPFRVNKTRRFQIVYSVLDSGHARRSLIFWLAIEMKRARSPETDYTAKRRRDVSEAEEFATLADTLASRPDLLRSDPLPREDPYVTDGVSRVALGRLSRAEASARPRTVATDVPQTPRRRGENRPASTFNRGPGYVPPSMTAPATQVIDLT